MDLKYPGVTVKLAGHDGNAFIVLGRTQLAMRDAGLTQAQLNEYKAEATSGDYDHLLQTTMRYVNVE